MSNRVYLRPTAFVDSPIGLDGKAQRLAGGLTWFSAVEVLTDQGIAELLPVEAVETALARLGDEARSGWERLIAPRPALVLGHRTIRLDQPQVMGIVNATPDSFSDGGVHEDAGAAAEAGMGMTALGAAIIDVGGESTRPGSATVWEGDELRRVLPVIEQLAGAGTAISIDTRKASVMEAVLSVGPALINDVSALVYDPRAAAVVAAAGCPVVLMHHQGDPATMQKAPHYDRTVLLDVYDWLERRIEEVTAKGIARERILIDPGIGFGKTLRHNLDLMNGLSLFHGLGCPILLGASRKRMIGALSNEAPPEKRLAGSLALALKAAEQGAQIIRVHDVAETVQALRVWRGLRDAALTLP